MITRRDCILLLSELSYRGVAEATQYIQHVSAGKPITTEIVRFINDNRLLDVTNFYEKLRRSYNMKRSSLYKNIVTCDEEDCTKSVLTTLASLSLQILLYADSVSDLSMFLKHTRFEQIQHVLLEYSKTYDLVSCVKVLQLVKADLKAFEMISRNN